MSYINKEQAIDLIESMIADKGVAFNPQKLAMALKDMESVEIVRCKDCKWYDPPHIKYNDGTREDFPKEPFVTADIGSTIGGKCIAKNKIYCIAHDRENPDDYEEIVMFRSPDDYCSYGETKVTSKLKNPCDSLLKSDPDECKEKKSKLDTDLISRQAAIEAMAPFDTNHELRDTLEGLPSVEPPKKVEPKTDLVNRSDVLELVKSGALISVEKYENYKKMCKAINGLPSCHTCRECEPERPKGEWIEVEGYNGDIHYQCNQCGDEFILIDGTPEDNNYLYCPNCGAYMRGDKE